MTVEDDTTMKFLFNSFGYCRLSYSLSKLCAHLLIHSMKKGSKPNYTFHSIYSLLNPKYSLYSSSNNYSKHEPFWMYLKRGTVIKYKGESVLVESINSDSVLVKNQNEQTFAIPLYSNDVEMAPEVLLRVYQDWVGDLRYGEMVDIQLENNSFAKGYFISEDEDGGKMFSYYNGLTDSTITINPVEPSRVAMHNTL